MIRHCLYVECNIHVHVLNDQLVIHTHELAPSPEGTAYLYGASNVMLLNIVKS